MSNNLADGLLNRLERARKYAFGCLVVAGEDNPNIIIGYFIIRGKAGEMIEEVVDAADYDSYSWVKVKVDDAEKAKMTRFLRDQVQEPIWCLSTLDKTQRSILGQAWLVHKRVPPPDTMEWMAELIDSHYKIVRYWFHCRVNFEAINKAMQENPDVGLLMPGIDNWYELEYFTHPPASSSKKPKSSSATEQRAKQTTKHNKSAASKGRANHLKAAQESSDDNSSEDSPEPDPNDKSVVRRQGAPNASKKRHAPSVVDESETASTKHARLAISAHSAVTTMGRDVDMRDTDTVDHEPTKKLSRYSSTNLKNIQVTVEIPVFQRRSSRQKKDATPASDPSKIESVPSTVFSESSAASTLMLEESANQVLPVKLTAAALSSVNQPMGETVYDDRQCSSEDEHAVPPNATMFNYTETRTKVNKARPLTKENEAQSSTSTAAAPSKVSQKIDEHSHGSLFPSPRATRRFARSKVSTLKTNSDDSVITKSLSNEPFASIEIMKIPKESRQSDLLPLPTNVLPEPVPSSVASSVPSSTQKWGAQELMLPIMLKSHASGSASLPKTFNANDSAGRPSEHRASYQWINRIERSQSDAGSTVTSFRIEDDDQVIQEIASKKPPGQRTPEELTYQLMRRNSGAWDARASFKAKDNQGILPKTMSEKRRGSDWTAILQRQNSSAGGTRSDRPGTYDPCDIDDSGRSSDIRTQSQERDRDRRDASHCLPPHDKKVSDLPYNRATMVATSHTHIHDRGHRQSDHQRDKERSSSHGDKEDGRSYRSEDAHELNEDYGRNTLSRGLARDSNREGHSRHRDKSREHH
ncbi:hypothetical protein BGZ52_000015 [Haplosporangium bisporale]|nr:hypothetical protein BGZ52_000015 [Haplosporangium bisporale]KAF9217767.1 hypothetical protein BGZ59_011209 [Podila verticillata]